MSSARLTRHLFHLTDAAAAQVQALILQRGKPSVGIRIGVKTRGCSGLAYTLEYVDERPVHHDVVEDKGVTIFIDPQAALYVVGTTMDFKDDKVSSGFVFVNPNEKGRCGCGESFRV